MSSSQVPLVFSGHAVLVIGASVSPTTAVPDNCHTIIMLETSGNPALVGFAIPGGAVVEGTDGTRLPASAGLTWVIGDHPPMDEAALTGSGLVIDGIPAGVVPTVQFTYLCRTGRTPS